MVNVLARHWPEAFLTVSGKLATDRLVLKLPSMCELVRIFRKEPNVM
jgi:hypothetical protein